MQRLLSLYFSARPGLGFTACAALVAILLACTTTGAVVIVDDSWADGGRDNGPDPLDSNWWTSASPAGIEVSVGSLGMVTGPSGRGIHTIFPTQTLSNIGDALKATYTFTTPATVGMGGTGGFRAGLFDTLGRAGLDADVSASSSSPNALYGWGTGATPPGPGTAGLPGYMLDMDVGTGSEDLNFRAHDAGTVNPTGRLIGTTTGFISLSPSGPDGAYVFAPNRTYVGSMTITRISATEVEISASLGSATHSVIDTFDSESFGMLAFWANSNLFGSSNTPNTDNNGIDFTNVKIELIPILGDFNGDGLFNCLDIDSLVAQIVAGTNPIAFDLTGDGLVNQADLTQWRTNAGGINLPSGNPYRVADANLDGVVDGSDFGIWNANKFTSVAAWCSGDFSADGVVDGSDFGIWNANKFTSANAGSAVPEPTPALLWLTALLLSAFTRAVDRTSDGSPR